jgi:hypothetical protein
MKDEKKTLRAGLALVKVISKKLAQETNNAALTVLQQLVQS